MGRAYLLGAQRSALGHALNLNGVIPVLHQLVSTSTLIANEFVVWNKIPPELAGLWEVEDGPLKRSTFEFFRNGDFEQTLKVNSKGMKRDVARKTRVALKDKTLLMITKDTQTRKETTAEANIRELTADTLILELEQGDVLRLVRIE